MGYSETGAEQLLGNMKAIQLWVKKEGQKEALRAGGRVIKAAMVDRTPVLIEKTAGSTSLEPGEVKASISVRVRQDEDNEAVAYIGPKSPDGDVGKAAYLVEYGHRMVKGGPSRMNSFGKFVGSGVANEEQDVPAHPFLRPAFEVSVGEAIEVVATTLRTGIAAVGGK